MNRWVRTITVGLLLTSGALAALGGSGAAASVRRPFRLSGSPPIVDVDLTTGTVGDSFTAAGTGCADGIVAYRDNGALQFAYAFNTDGTGKWSTKVRFPAPIGTHTILFGCYELNTAGTPTTFAGPGELRFDYQAFDVQTLNSTSMTMTTTPSTQEPEPAEPTPGRSDFTG